MELPEPFVEVHDRDHSWAASSPGTRNRLSIASSDLETTNVMTKYKTAISTHMMITRSRLPPPVMRTEERFFPWNVRSNAPIVESSDVSLIRDANSFPRAGREIRNI